MTALDIQKKIGKDIARRFAWVDYKVVPNFDEVGTTSFKDRIRVNSSFMAADLRVTLSGMRVHNDAGYGGAGEGRPARRKCAGHHRVRAYGHRDRQ
jgi:nickel-dependent lactate racemase